MYISNKNDNSQESMLVFALTQHATLGFLIEPFAVNITRKGQFEYGFKKVTKTTYGDYFDQLPQPQIDLIELLDKYSDENLQKRFNTKKLRTVLFYDTLEPEFVTNHIRPFLDKVIYQAVAFMTEHSLKLFFKGQSAERIHENELELAENYAECCFHFEKLENKTHYKLQIKYGQKDIVLFQKEASIISNKPCLLLLGNKVFRFEPDWEGKKLVPFFQKEFLEVPQSNEKQFYKIFVEKSIRNYPFVAKGFEVKVCNEPPTASLQLENHWQGNLALGLYFKYKNGISFHAGDTAVAQTRFIENNGQFSFEKVERDINYEKKITEFLLKTGLVKLDAAFYSLSKVSKSVPTASKEEITYQAHLFIDWMNLHIDQISALGIKLGKNFSGTEYFTGKMSIKLDVDEKADWFDLFGMVHFGSFKVPFLDLKKNIIAGNREYVLADGSIALIPEEWLTKYLDLMKFGVKNGDKLEVKKHHFTLLDREIGTSAKFSSFELSEFAKQNHTPPDNLNAQLRPYQLIGYNWMMYLHAAKMGGCLADDMGLGKTLQTLALLTTIHNTPQHSQQEELVEVGESYEHVSSGTNGSAKNKPEPSSLSLKEINQNGPGLQMDLFTNKENIHDSTPCKCSLIIMPLSLIHNWMNEASRFAPELRIFRHTGSSRRTDMLAFRGYDVILTTYGTVRNDIEFLKQIPFNYIVLDESQIIKNASSKIFSTIKKLQCEHRLVLTGTPVENSLTDLWSQFSFINPGMLGSLKFFKEEFVVPIEKKQDKLKSEKLQKLIQPFILRRTKDQVAKELPPLTEKVHYCEMTSEQEKYYERKKSEIRNTIIQNIENHGVDKSRFVVLSGLTRLRLIANHPAIIDREYIHESGKYLEIIRNIDKLLSENHKVLIFSQFVKHLNLFADYFQKHSLKYSLLTGGTAEKDRMQVIKEFQEDPQRQLFLISLRAGGVGLNLTGADYVFMLDPWWNPAVENQAINRAHRIGQNKNVFVYKFITRNTVEEKIVNLQQKKSHLAGIFINQNNPLKSMDVQDLKEIML